MAQPAHVLAGGPGIPRHSASLLPAVTPRPHTGHTLAGFHNLLFIDSVLFCQVINILDFSFRDCGLKQKAGLYYGQMARQENLRY